MKLTFPEDEVDYLQDENTKLREQRQVLMDVLADIQSEGHMGDFYCYVNKFLSKYRVEYEFNDECDQMVWQVKGDKNIYECFEDALFRSCLLYTSPSPRDS